MRPLYVAGKRLTFDQKSSRPRWHGLHRRPPPTILEGPEAATMKQTHQLTAIIEREGEGYVALCAELDNASQGETGESARRNLVEAGEPVFETPGPRGRPHRPARRGFLPPRRGPISRGGGALGSRVRAGR